MSHFSLKNVNVHYIIPNPQEISIVYTLKVLSIYPIYVKLLRPENESTFSNV